MRRRAGLRLTHARRPISPIADTVVLPRLGGWIRTWSIDDIGAPRDVPDLTCGFTGEHDDDWDPIYPPRCEAEFHGYGTHWRCTRVRGHDRRHAAGDGEIILAVWP